MIIETTNVLHHGPALCETWVPTSRHRELITSLVCGVPLPSNQARRLFLDTGLIHIMVVSGAHLLFLESLLGKAPVWIRLPVLGFYCWLTGFGAPVVKAFFRRVVELKLRRIGWTNLQIEAVSIGAAILVWPPWVLSKSLQMSWVCALALALPALLAWRALDQALKVHALLFVFVGGSFTSVLWNTVAAPFVGVVLFPISLAAMVWPVTTPLVERVWDIFLALLAFGPQSPPAAWFISGRDLFWLPLTLHIFFLAKEVRWRRARAFSY